MAAKRYTKKRREIPVEIEEEDGTVKTYTLRELKGSDRDRFLNIMGGKMKTGPDGKPQGIKDFTRLQSDLLSMSLFDEAGQLVASPVIDNWPASMQSDLFKDAQTLSGLGEKIEEAKIEAKND